MRGTLMTNEEFLKEAFRYFHPRVPDDKRDEAAQSLLDILERYKELALKRVIMGPLKRIDESDEEHEGRSIEHARLVLKRRGRPPNLPQDFLVLDLRNLLATYGCNYGVLKDEGDSYLVPLATLVDSMAGKPKGYVDWQSVAVKCANPFYSLELVTGQPLNVPAERRADFKRSLHLAARKAKHKKP